MEKNNSEIVEDQPEMNQTLRLQIAEKEIFENITQCLCLAKIQMGRIEINKPEEACMYIGEANLLIGKAIKDLCNLVKQFKEHN